MTNKDKLTSHKRKKGLKSVAFAMALMLAVSQMGIETFAENEANASVTTKGETVEKTENGSVTEKMEKGSVTENAATEQKSNLSADAEEAEKNAKDEQIRKTDEKSQAKNVADDESTKSDEKLIQNTEEDESVKKGKKSGENEKLTSNVEKDKSDKAAAKDELTKTAKDELAKAEDEELAKTAEETELDAEEELVAFEMSKSCKGVRVTLKAPKGVFPEGSYFEVKTVSNSVEENIEEALEDVRGENEQVKTSYTYDITVYDKDDNEIEPDTSYGKVKVTFSFEEAADKNLEAKVYHIEGKGKNLSVEELESSVTGDKVTTVTDSFSYYTVEFTFCGELQYVLDGDSEVALSKILDKCGLSGKVTKAVSSAPKLFSTEERNGVWYVKALKAFSSEETLTVTIDGHEYEILVTDAQEPVKYLAWKHDSQLNKLVPVEKEVTEYTVYNGQKTLGSGWYVVKGNHPVTDKIIINGGSAYGHETNIILCDGCTLMTGEEEHYSEPWGTKVPGGIVVGEGKGLNIYAQSSAENKMGVIKAFGYENAGIGGERNQDAGDITINGGKIIAKCHSYGAGIGGGDGMDYNQSGYENPAGINGNVHSITINGGKINATGCGGGAGIGGGPRGDVNWITISGGDITATSEGGAGIGGGYGGDAGLISINDGKVTARCDAAGLYEGQSAGIGGGCKFNDYGGNSGDIAIYGGEVTATSGDSGAGIGGGNGGKASSITISGGKVTATSGNSGAGIGAGNGSASGVITIDNGNVTATSGDSGAGIGGGGGNPSGQITINGGNVTATSNSSGAGIGGGSWGDGRITINGGNVTATSNEYGAGIGGGQNGDGGIITISDGNVTATSGESGAGIGGGAGAAGGTVIINGGSVTAKSDSGSGVGAGYQPSTDNGTLSLHPACYFESISGTGYGDGKAVSGTLKAVQNDLKQYLIFSEVDSEDTISFGEYAEDLSWYSTIKLVNSIEVTFDTNGGSAIPSKMMKYGTALPKPADPIMPGYEVECWEIKDGETYTPYDFSKKMTTSPIELRAKWTKKVDPKPDPDPEPDPGPKPTPDPKPHGHSSHHKSSSSAATPVVAKPVVTETGLLASRYVLSTTAGVMNSVPLPYVAGDINQAGWPNINKALMGLKTNSGKALEVILNGNSTVDNEFIKNAHAKKMDLVFTLDNSVSVKLPKQNSLLADALAAKTDGAGVFLMLSALSQNDTAELASKTTGLDFADVQAIGGTANTPVVKIFTSNKENSLKKGKTIDIVFDTNNITDENGNKLYKSGQKIYLYHGSNVAGVGCYMTGKVGKDGKATFTVPMVTSLWTVGPKNTGKKLYKL